MKIDMKAYFRAMTVFLAVVFAAATIMHAAEATAMTGKMAFSDIASAQLADCSECVDTAGVSPDCNDLCVTPCVNVATLSPCAPTVLSDAAANWTVRDLAGRTDAPSLTPPRFL